MDRRRILLIIAFILVTGLLGYALYRIFFAPKTQPGGVVPQPGITTTPGGNFPIPGTGGTPAPSPQGTGQLPTPGITQPTSPIRGTDESPVRQLVSDNILQPHIGGTGQVQFYDTVNGQFYRVDANGNLRTLSDNVFYNVQNVVWSPTKNEGILEYPDGANIYYNFDTKKQVTLPRHWEEFSFDPAGGQIAAKSMAFSPENRFLITANPDGTNVTAVEPLGENADKVIVSWSPNQQIIALSRTGEAKGADREEILFIGKNGENFPSTIVEGRDIRNIWSPTGDKMLYSVYSTRTNYTPELWIVNTATNQIGSGRKLLGVPTWADKCVFADDRYVYCAVPTEMPTGAGFAPQITANISDAIFRIDTTTGARTELLLDKTHTIQELFYSESDQSVYFTDTNNPGLFRAPL